MKSKFALNIKIILTKEDLSFHKCSYSTYLIMVFFVTPDSCMKLNSESCKIEKAAEDIGKKVDVRTMIEIHSNYTDIAQPEIHQVIKAVNWG